MAGFPVYAGKPFLIFLNQSNLSSMHINNKITRNSLLLLTVILTLAGCQKMTRPELKELILDPPPPPYSILKSFWEFENNTRDTGQYRTQMTDKAITYVTGVKGQAAKIGADGYSFSNKINDSLTKPGSLTVAFWMNGVGPVQGGAQGLFAISKNDEFWGNFEMFLENLNNGAEAFLKVHLWNSNAADGKGEEWNEIKIPGALNKWTHLAVTYNAADSKLTIYADGVPTAINGKVLGGGTYGPLRWKNASGIALGTFAFQTSPSLTNHGPESWAKSFNGSLDQVRVYNVALSAAEIKNLFDTKQ